MLMIALREIFKRLCGVAFVFSWTSQWPPALHFTKGQLTLNFLMFDLEEEGLLLPCAGSLDARSSLKEGGLM